MITTMAQRLTPSTVDNGFILTTPALKNPATSDLVFQRILQCKLLWKIQSYNQLSTSTPLYALKFILNLDL